MKRRTDVVKAAEYFTAWVDAQTNGCVFYICMCICIINMPLSGWEALIMQMSKHFSAVKQKRNGQFMKKINWMTKLLILVKIKIISLQSYIIIIALYNKSATVCSFSHKENWLKKMQKWPATNMDLNMHLLGTTTRPQQWSIHANCMSYAFF